LQLRAGRNTIPTGANAAAAVREAAGSRVLPARLQNAMLPGEIPVRFATHAGSAGTNWQSRPILAFRRQFRCDVGFA